MTGAIVEAMDKDYFDTGELKTWVEDAVKEYNQETGSSLEVKKYEVEDNTAKVTIEYPSLADYSGFNNVEAFQGSIAQAEEAGYTFDGEFVSAKGKPSVTYKELQGSKTYHVVILEEAEALTVSLEKDILYASGNVKVNGKKATVTEPKAKELAYIIYKP